MARKDAGQPRCPVCSHGVKKEIPEHVVALRLMRRAVRDAALGAIVRVAFEEGPEQTERLAQKVNFRVQAAIGKAFKGLLWEYKR